MGTMTRERAVADDRVANDQGVLAPNPFTRAARKHTETFMDRSVALAAGSSLIGPEDVPAFGYLSNIFLRVDFTGGAGGAAVVKEDGPFSVIREIRLIDVNGTPLVQLSGYELYLANKFGGYRFSPDPKSSPFYTALSVDGNGSFVLRIPVEIRQRDAFGALSNQNSAQNFKVQIDVGPSTDVFSTPPAGALPTVRFRATMEAWTQPLASDAFGRPNAQMPPAHGSIQQWTRWVRNISAGNQVVTLPRVGNMIRNLIFILRTTAPARSNTNFPDPWQLQLDGQLWHNAWRDYLRHEQVEEYGFAVGGLETGVFVLPFTQDFDGHPGGELGDLYLPTTQGTRLDLVGSFGADGTLTVLTNDVQPRGNIYVD